jgi:hypothetical protein
MPVEQSIEVKKLPVAEALTMTLVALVTRLLPTSSASSASGTHAPNCWAPVGGETKRTRATAPAPTVDPTKPVPEPSIPKPEKKEKKKPVVPDKKEKKKVKK